MGITTSSKKAAGKSSKVLAALTVGMRPILRNVFNIKISIPILSLSQGKRSIILIKIN